MRHLRIIEEIQRTPWAMTLPSFRAMLSVIEGFDLKEADHKYFHSLQASERDKALDVFGRPIQGAHYASTNNNVGYLMIDGPITPRATVFNDISGMTSLDVLTSDFQKLEEDPAIDTIVMLFDSPGGVAKGLADFNSVVRNSKKKTISYTWMAASAAYWMASAADRIVSSPDGEVGSIGAVATIRDYRKADERRGIQTFEVVSAQSPNKRPDPATEEGRDVIQELVNQFADEFIMAVASNRSTTKEDVLKYYGKGAMMTARHALTAGMIDDFRPADVFAESIIKKEITYQIQTNISATAEQPQAEEFTMSKDQAMTAEKLKEQYPAAVEEIVAAAKAEERERVQAIEALAEGFDDGLPAVKSAVVAKINKRKWNEGQTEATMSKELLSVVARAQVNAVEEFGASRRAAADDAAHASQATPEPTPLETNSKENHEKNVNALVAGYDANEKEGSHV